MPSNKLKVAPGQKRLETTGINKFTYNATNVASFDSFQTLRKFVRNCLIEAEKRRLNSIAIPAVGTGVLGFPSDLVVNSLFNEADKFSASNPNTTVNEIRFVIYDKDQKTFDVSLWLITEIESEVVARIPNSHQVVH